MVDHQHCSGCCGFLEHIIIAQHEFPPDERCDVRRWGGLSARDDRRWNWRLESRLYPQTGMSALRTVFCSLLSRSSDCDPIPLALSFQPYFRCRRDISLGRGNCYIGGDADNTDIECGAGDAASGLAGSGGCAVSAGEGRLFPGRALLGGARQSKKAVKHKKTQRNTIKHTKTQHEKSGKRKSGKAETNPNGRHEGHEAERRLRTRLTQNNRAAVEPRGILSYAHSVFPRPLRTCVPPGGI